jgi:integrase
VLLAMFTSLRWSELGGLRWCDIDLAAPTVRVTRQLVVMRGGGFTFGSPKSRACRRVVTIPDPIVPIAQWHLASFAQEGNEGLLFTSPAGRPLHHSNFRRRVWLPALLAAEAEPAGSDRGRNGHGTGNGLHEDHQQKQRKSL